MTIVAQARGGEPLGAQPCAAVQPRAAMQTTRGDAGRGSSGDAGRGSSGDAGRAHAARARFGRGSRAIPRRDLFGRAIDASGSQIVHSSRVFRVRARKPDRPVLDCALGQVGGNRGGDVRFALARWLTTVLRTTVTGVPGAERSQRIPKPGPERRVKAVGGEPSSSGHRARRTGLPGHPRCVTGTRRRGVCNAAVPQPDLERGDVHEALCYAAQAVRERELPLAG